MQDNGFQCALADVETRPINFPLCMPPAACDTSRCSIIVRQPLLDLFSRLSPMGWGRWQRTVRSCIHCYACRAWIGIPVGTDTPTLLLANRNRPVRQPIDLLAMGPAYCSAYVRLHCLVNNLPCWATGQFVR